MSTTVSSLSTSTWLRLLRLAALLLVCTATTATSATPTTDDDNDTTLVIGLSFEDSALPPHPQTGISDEEHTVLLMTCHYHQSESSNTSSEDTASSRCCHAMIRAAQAAKEKDDLSEIAGELLSHLETINALSQCEQEGSAVPQGEGGDHNLLLLRYAYYAASMPNQRRQSQQQRSNSNLYLWNDSHQQHQTGKWLDEMSLELEPSTWVTPFINSNHSPRPVGSNFQSILSQSGGMHRSLEHTLEIPLQDDILQPLLQSQNKNDNDDDNDLYIAMKASFLLMIPTGMFMDAEDAFDGHRWSVTLASVDERTGATTAVTTPLIKEDQYTLSLYTETIMDIEQPAFDSPQHAVLVTLEWNSTTGGTTIDGGNNSLLSTLQQIANNKNSDGKHNNSMEDLSLVFRFATKVHLRYPSPAASTTDASSLYQPVLLIPPIWISGSLALLSAAAVDPPSNNTVVFQQLNDGNSPWNVFGFRPPTSLVDDASSTTTATNTTTTTWVASAPQDDFVWVAILTVLFSLLGAIMLGYETSTIVHE